MDKTTDIAGKIIDKALNQVPIDPLLRPAAEEAGKELGKTANTIFGFINAALTPIWMINRGTECFRENFTTYLETKVACIPEKQRQLPPLYIAGPAVQAMLFAEDVPELRELYANLLASSMDSERVALAHPSFVEIIKQITPDEARIINLFRITKLYMQQQCIADWTGRQMYITETLQAIFGKSM